MNGIGESLFATLFPSDCRICRKPLVNISRLPVCRDCLSQIHAISCEVCAICGESIATPYALGMQPEKLLCGACRQDEPPFAKAVAYGSYNGNLRELIHLLKYEQVKPVAQVLGAMLAEAIEGIKDSLPAEGVVVVPVPLHKSKRRQRAFNQAEMIARAALDLLKKNGSAGLRTWMLNKKALVRCRATQSQIGLTRAQRRENMRGAFAVPHPKAVQNQTVLLIDDVVTTGTTVAECARILSKAGASKVYVASVARTLRIEAQGFGVGSFAPELDSEDLAATGS